MMCNTQELLRKKKIERILWIFLANRHFSIEDYLCGIRCKCQDTMLANGKQKSKIKYSSRILHVLRSDMTMNLI